ncbi:hypothetical protein V6N13_028281 [Hibiscus sabdariffa]
MTDQDYLFDVKVDAFSKVDDCSNETVGLTDIEIDVDGEVEGETEGQAKDESYNDSSSDTKGKLRIIPKLTLQEIQCLENEELHVDVPINLCSKARMWTKYGINGRFKYEFDMLFDYAAALRQADPNCNVDLMVVRPTPNHHKIFRRIYICFGATKEGFRKYCRPIVNLDGCFLKERETRETCRWFLENLKTDLHLRDGVGFTIMSDMQKGLIEEISITLPVVEHRFCERHFYCNWKKCTKAWSFKRCFGVVAKAPMKLISIIMHLDWVSCKVSRKKSPRIANLSPKSKTLTPEQQPNVPSKSPNFHVSKQKFEKKGNISTQRSSSTACSTREVTDMKGKGKAKEQPRTQPIRPNRKLHDADTKDGL